MLGSTDCTCADSSAIQPADPAAPVSFAFPDSSVDPEGQICREVIWEGDSIDDGSYDDMAG